MNDTAWQLLRYALIAGGTYFAKGSPVAVDQIAPLADQIISTLGTVVATGGAVWGLYVKWNTRNVSAVTAARSDVPTTSPITGAVEKQGTK